MALDSLLHKSLASSAWNLHSGWSLAEVNQKAARAAHLLPPNLITTWIFISPSNINLKGKNLWWQRYAAQSLLQESSEHGILVPYLLQLQNKDTLINDKWTRIFTLLWILKSLSLCSDRHTWKRIHWLHFMSRKHQYAKNSTTPLPTLWNKNNWSQTNNMTRH